MHDTIEAIQTSFRWLHTNDIDTILAVLAIIFAVVQFLDSRAQKREMKAVAKSMSTRFVGQFPANMSEIIDIVKNTDRTLDILVDVAAYGHYSTPGSFANYMTEIEKACKAKRKIRMIVYDTAIYDRLRIEQFPEASYADEVRSERFAAFFGANKHLDKPVDWKGFQTLLVNEQETFLKVFQRTNVLVRSLGNPLLMSIWLEDNEDAVFAFQNPLDHEKEVSFRTRDGNLIAVLHQVFEQTWAQAVDRPFIP